MCPLLLLSVATLNLALLPTLAAQPRILLSEITLGRLPELARPDQITVSPDGRRAAYVAQQGLRAAAVVNGVQGNPHEWIVRGYIGFTADSKHVIYQIRKGPKMATVIDGNVGKLYDSVDYWVCSPSGARIAYVAKRGPRYLPVIDGIEGKEYDNVRIAALSASGRTAIIAEIAGKDCLIVDGDVGRLHDRILDAAFSPDAKRIAYRARRNENSLFMVIDGIPGDNFPLVETPVFSLDGSRVAYAAGNETSRTLFVNAAPITPPTGKFTLGPAFSPDGKRLAYVVSTNADSAAVVLDSTVGKNYDSISQLRFSPNGKRTAYVASKASRTMLVIDGNEIGHYDAISPDSLAFSPDSAHLACIARRDNHEFIVIDAAESKPYDRLLIGDALRFANDGAVHAIGLRDRIVTRQAETGPLKVHQRDLFALELRLAQ